MKKLRGNKLKTSIGPLIKLFPNELHPYITFLF